MSPLWSDWWSENNLAWFTLDAVAQAQMSLSAILGPLAQMRWVGRGGLSRLCWWRAVVCLVSSCCSWVLWSPGSLDVPDRS